ncbi:hypothetical protein MUP59_02775 [Candidatus Bathyarchaeota archaeon]|nr:hypothetical protein [Candidatus Bathyarchaeota archaeon]
MACSNRALTNNMSGDSVNQSVLQQTARKIAPEKSVMKEKRLKKVVGEGYVKMADRYTQCNSPR